MHPFKKERLLLELTQRQCSQMTGINQSKISSIERGYRIPTVDDAQRLARIVEGDASKLFPKQSVWPPALDRR